MPGMLAMMIPSVLVRDFIPRSEIVGVKQGMPRDKYITVTMVWNNETISSWFNQFLTTPVGIAQVEQNWVASCGPES